jgi:protein gp37
MAVDTKIEWCDSTVNPTAGCEGCELWTPRCHACYAGNIFPRLGYGTEFTEAVHLQPGKMADAARWSDRTGKPRPTKPWLNDLPRLIFISDMSDALSSSVSFDFLQKEIIDTVLSEPGRRHQWIWPTKQPKRMAEFSGFLKEQGIDWPRHLWAGTSVTTHKTTNRITHLLKVGNQDTLHLVSVEPQLESINLERWLPKLDWIIQGGESDQQNKFQARPFDITWAKDLIQQCKNFNVPIFVKQMGSAPCRGGRKVNLEHKKGGDWEEWPNKRLRVRQFPPMPEVTLLVRSSQTMPRKKSTAAEETLDTKLEKIADSTRRVAKGIQSGFFVYGRTGTSKSYTIETTLKDMGVNVSLIKGHITPQIFFDELCANPSGVIILDDVVHVLSNDTMVDLLLAGIGKQTNDVGKRIVPYKSSVRKGDDKGKKAQPEVVEFTGGIIIISNIPMGEHRLHMPLLGRMFPKEHDLTDDEMEVLFYKIAKKAFSIDRDGKKLKLTQKECREVAEFVLQKCKEIGLRPNVRHLVEIGFPCRLDRDSSFHWKVHVEDGLREAHKIEGALVAKVVEGRSDDISELINLVYESKSKKEVKDRWMEKGDSRATFFRKLSQLKEVSPQTWKVYDSLDSPEAGKMKKRRLLFRESVEDLADMLQESKGKVTKANLIQWFLEMDESHTKKDFHSQLAEHPELRAWFDGLPG